MAFIGKQPAKAAITSTDITDGVVTADKLASDSVTTAKIADNGVTTAKINADAVTDAKIADDVVGTEHLTAGEVDTTALGADAVTAAKIADDAISDEHLDPTAITGQTAETSVADDDLVLISDTSASAALKKMTVSNLVANAGGGKVLQVVSTTKTDVFTANTNSFVDITGMSVSITPSASNSKVMIICSINIGGQNGTLYAYKLLRGSTDICIGDAASNRTRATIFGQNTGSSFKSISQSITFLDSPSTTSSTTYKIQGRAETSSNQLIAINAHADDTDSANVGRGASTITVMEIGA